MATTLVRYQARRNTAATWTTSNEILLAGEPGYESDTGKFKLGDGSTGWNSLRYQLGGTDLDIRDYGAKLDGVTDDLPALRAALTAASAGVSKTVRIPAGTLYAKFAAVVVPPAGVTIRGEGAGRTTILADPGTPGTAAECFDLNNPDTLIQGVTIRRATDFPLVMIAAGPTSNSQLRDVTLDGRRDTLTTNYCHGIQVGRHTATATGFTATACTFTRLSYGLFQANASTGTVDGLSFDRCTFTGNTATDLEFNAPASTMTRVRVTRCNFTNNVTTAAGAGFAVGLAHVTDAVIRDCTVTGTYNNEAIHFEDYSTDVTVTGCTFRSGGLTNGSVVQIISGCSRVRILGNTFDTTGNTSSNYVINALAGGTGSTPGGRPSIAPFHLDIADNDFRVTGTCRGIYLEVVLYANITGNRMEGPGTIVSGSYAGSFTYAIRGFFATGTRITGNYIRKFTHGIFPAVDGNQSFGGGSIIAANTFESCLLGIGATNIDGVTITGNTINLCQFPMIVGHGSYTNGPATITGNQATGCTNPFGIYGTATITATGTAATGTGVTVPVASLPNVIPDGTTVVFSGGGTLTTTGAAGIDARALTGTITGATITSGQTGLAYLRYSYNAAKNITLANNSDDYWAAAGYGRRTATTATSYTVLGHEELIVATAAGITVTLGPAANYIGQSFTVKNTTTGTVTVAAAAGSVETPTLAAGAVTRWTSTGASWIAA